MSSPPPPAPVPLLARAEDSLRYIRDTLETSASFTAVPGRGSMAMGLVGLGAAALSALPAWRPHWVWVWVAAAPVAVLIGGGAMLRKSRRAGQRISRGAGRRFLLGLVPSFLTGAVLTAAFLRHGIGDFLPGTWLLLYGAAVLAAGAFSVPTVRWLGGAFMALGAAAFVLPDSWSLGMLGMGFGGANLVFGALIAKRHGG